MIEKERKEVDENMKYTHDKLYEHIKKIQDDSKEKEESKSVVIPEPIIKTPVVKTY